MNVPGHVLGFSLNGNHTIISSGERQRFKSSDPLPMTNETNFDLASLTKIFFTTNILMKLVESDIIQLEDRVSKYLSAWRESEKETITIRHLLTHTSGLAPWRPFYISHNSKTSMYASIASQPLHGKVGTSRVYSDLGFIVLGEIIEHIFQSNLETVFEDQISTPFALVNTRFATPVNVKNVAATSFGDVNEYSMVESGRPYLVAEKVEDFAGWRQNVLVGEVNDGNAFHLLKGVSSHAGLFSDASDILRICDVYLKSLNNESMYKAKTVETFIEPCFDSMQNLGFRNWEIFFKDRSYRVIGHTGFTGVSFGLIPELDFAGLMLTNRLHTEGTPVATEELWGDSLRYLLSQI